MASLDHNQVSDPPHSSHRPLTLSSGILRNRIHNLHTQLNSARLDFNQGPKRRPDGNEASYRSTETRLPPQRSPLKGLVTPEGKAKVSLNAVTDVLQAENPEDWKTFDVFFSNGPPYDLQASLLSIMLSITITSIGGYPCSQPTVPGHRENGRIE